MKLFFLFLTHTLNAFECKDKNVVLCANADCENKLNRLLCPEKCSVCKTLTETCQDHGQFCDVIDCQIPSARTVCKKTCG